MNRRFAFSSKAPESAAVVDPPIAPPASDEHVPQPQNLAFLERFDASWKFVLWLVIVQRVVLGIISVSLVHVGTTTPPIGQWIKLVLKGNQSWTQALSTWQRWDALWYQQIAQHGYGASNGTTAFYPLYPLIARIVSFPLAGNIVLAELIVSSVAFGCAMWLLYHLARMDVSRLAAYTAVVLVATFPTGFFFAAPYSESIFLALTLASLWFARRGQPWAAGIVGVFAALTRAQGVLLILPLAFEYFRQRRALNQRPNVAMFAALLPSVGWAAYSLYVQSLSPTSSTPVSAESFWHYSVVPPWQALSSSWQYITRSGDIPELLNLICLLGFGLLAIGVSRRLPFVYSLYVWPFLVLLFTRHMGYSPLMSVSRLVLVLFPCFILAAAWLARRPWLASALVITSLLFQMGLFTYFVYWWFIA